MLACWRVTQSKPQRPPVRGFPEFPVRPPRAEGSWATCRALIGWYTLAPSLLKGLPAGRGPLGVVRRRYVCGFHRDSCLHQTFRRRINHAFSRASLWREKTPFQLLFKCRYCLLRGGGHDVIIMPVINILVAMGLFGWAGELGWPLERRTIPKSLHLSAQSSVWVPLSAYIQLIQTPMSADGDSYLSLEDVARRIRSELYLHGTALADVHSLSEPASISPHAPATHHSIRTRRKSNPARITTSAGSEKRE